MASIKFSSVADIQRFQFDGATPEQQDAALEAVIDFAANEEYSIKERASAIRMVTAEWRKLDTDLSSLSDGDLVNMFNRMNRLHQIAETISDAIKLIITADPNYVYEVQLFDQSGLVRIKASDLDLEGATKYLVQWAKKYGHDAECGGHGVHFEPHDGTEYFHVDMSHPKHDNMMRVAFYHIDQADTMQQFACMMSVSRSVAPTCMH